MNVAETVHRAVSLLWVRVLLLAKREKKNALLSGIGNPPVCVHRPGG